MSNKHLNREKSNDPEKEIQQAGRQTTILNRRVNPGPIWNLSGAEWSEVKVPHVRRRSVGVAAVKAHVSQSQLRAEPHLHAWWPRAESLSGKPLSSPTPLLSSSRQAEAVH